MAAMNGVSSAEFAVDMGFSIKRLIFLEEVAVESLVALGGLNADERETLISWTGEALGEVRMSFRGETFVTRALRNPSIRGCPACLREDAKSFEGPATAAMVMRGDWQLRNVNICVRHEHPLVELWKVTYPVDRYDCGVRLKEISDRILEGAFNRPLQSPTAYDLWLDKRLGTGIDTTWLKDQTLFAATTFCQLLGTELLRLHTSSGIAGASEDATARAIGFEVARHGETAIMASLNDLAAQSKGAGDEPNKAFGALFTQLARGYRDEVAFDPFRDIVRDCIFALWPIAGGEVILGKPLEERRLHSVSSAAKETGIGPALLTQFLVTAGAFSKDDERPDARKTFDARRYASLLNEIPELIGPIEMRNLMSATLSQFKSLVDDSVLVPAINIPTVKSPWRREDGIALITELSGYAQQIDVIDPLWESLHAAKIRSGIRTGVIIEAVRTQQLQLGARAGQAGYAGLCVLKNEIDALIGAPLRPKHVQDLTVSAFGRQIGMRAKGRFLALIADGHTPATEKINPTTGAAHLYMTEKDIQAFHQRFMTSPTMEAEFGQHRRKLLTEVLAAGVNPFAPNGEDYGYVFLRSEVEAIFRYANS